MNSSENTQGEKLLTVQSNDIWIYLNTAEIPEIIENPVSILWKNKGVYGWIPAETVKYKLQQCLDQKANCPESNLPKLEFSWQQAHQLKQDVGKTLEGFVKRNIILTYLFLENTKYDGNNPLLKADISDLISVLEQN